MSSLTSKRVKRRHKKLHATQDFRMQPVLSIAEVTQNTVKEVNKFKYSTNSHQIVQIQRIGLVLQQYRLALHSTKFHKQFHPTIQQLTDQLIGKVLDGVATSIFSAKPGITSEIQIQHHNAAACTISLVLHIMQEFLSPQPNVSVSSFIAYPKLFQLIGILHQYDPHSYVFNNEHNHYLPYYLPIVVWRNNCNMRFRSEFTFHCSNCSRNELQIATHLTNTEILAVRHGTTAMNMLQILQPVLQRGVNPTPRLIHLRGCRSGSSEQFIKDICPQGLIYFDIDMTSLNRKIDNPHPYRNRYGACVIKLQQLTKANDTPSGWNYFKLGTKKYSKGFSQLLLATEKNLDEWWIMEEWKTEVQKLQRLDLDNFAWPLIYCKKSCPNDFWTHPEILVDGNLHLPLDQVRIRFESGHKCFNLLDGRRRNCLECEIMECGGLCYANVGGIWRIVRLNCINSEELSIEMFARSMPSLQRKKLIQEVSRLPNLFDMKQFDKIIEYWNDMNHCFVQEWKAFKI